MYYVKIFFYQNRGGSGETLTAHQQRPSPGGMDGSWPENSATSFGQAESSRSSMPAVHVRFVLCKKCRGEIFSTSLNGLARIESLGELIITTVFRKKVLSEKWKHYSKRMMRNKSSEKRDRQRNVGTEVIYSGPGAILFSPRCCQGPLNRRGIYGIIRLSGPKGSSLVPSPNFTVRKPRLNNAL